MQGARFAEYVRAGKAYVGLGMQLGKYFFLISSSALLCIFNRVLTNVRVSIYKSVVTFVVAIAKPIDRDGSGKVHCFHVYWALILLSITVVINVTFSLKYGAEKCRKRVSCLLYRTNF